MYIYEIYRLVETRLERPIRIETLSTETQLIVRPGETSRGEGGTLAGGDMAGVRDSPCGCGGWQQGEATSLYSPHSQSSPSLVHALQYEPVHEYATAIGRSQPPTLDRPWRSTGIIVVKCICIWAPWLEHSTGRWNSFGSVPPTPPSPAPWHFSNFTEHSQRP